MVQEKNAYMHFGYKHTCIYLILFTREIIEEGFYGCKGF